MSYCDLSFFAQCSIGPVNQNIMRRGVCFELIYMKSWSGAGTLYYDGGSHQIEKGDIIILPPTANYRFDWSGTGSCIFMGFDHCDLLKNAGPFVIKDSGELGITCLLEIMKTEFESHCFRRGNMLNLLCNAVVIKVLRTLKAADDKTEIENDNLKYILHFMEAQSQNGIAIEEIAKMSGLSYHRFRHKFKELTGISPQQYVISQRLNFAKRLLTTTSYSTSSVAVACGFHSVPQFITCFSHQEGLTPIKYRKKYKTGQNAPGSAVKRMVPQKP